MLYYYGRFAVDISPSFNLDKNNPDLLYGKCQEVQFSGEGNSYESIFSDFKNHVDNRKKDMKVVTAEDISRIFTEMEEKYGKDKAIGILVGKTQECVRLTDGKSAAQILFEKLQEHQNKEEKKMKDKDLAVVEQYLFSLEKVYLEMKALVEVKRLDSLALVRDVKLNNLYEFYKGMIPLGSLDQVREFYLNKYVNRDV